MSPSRRSIIIIGAGWAGQTLSNALDDKIYSITVIAPETTTPYTPLLASAACGLYDYSLVELPIRHTDKHIKVVKASVHSIDFDKKVVYCTPAFKDIAVDEFELRYDFVVIAPGCTNQTFGTPGVAEHALFLRNAKDAMNVSARVQDCFEKASIPGLTEQQQSDLLHFVIVGAGPTGVGVSSELSDLFDGGYAKLYRHLKGKVSISIHDIADHVLSSFDTKLQDYAMSSFKKRQVEVLTGSHIERVEADCLYTRELGRIGCGVVIWATGNKSVPLVDGLPVRKTPRNPRILTDDFMRVYHNTETGSATSFDGTSPLDRVFAIGDAADVLDARLPATAEVACQKANYLADAFNHGFSKKFEYKQTSIVAYLGQNDGVISGKRDYEGRQAWLAWRSKNFLWTRTWRQKVLIVVTWCLDLVTGRFIAPR